MMMHRSLHDNDRASMAVTIDNADQLIQGFLRKRGLLATSFMLPAEIDVSPPLKRTKQQKKSVQFSPHLYVRTFESTRSYAPDLWYQRDEYISFMQDCRRHVVLQIQHQEKEGAPTEVGNLMKSEDSFNVCVRGLEDHLIPGLYLMKRERKKTLIRMIVRQHHANKDHLRDDVAHHHAGRSKTDLENLRSISTMFSHQSTYVALNRAIIDEKNR
jgi:hypothetical protein